MMRVNSTVGRMGMAMLFFAFFAFSGPIQISAQATFQGSVVNLEAQAVLPEVATYQVYQLDLAAIHAYVQSNSSRVDMTLELGGMTLPMSLFPNPVRRASAKVFLSTATGVKQLPSRPNTTFAGELQTVQGGEIRLLIDQDMIGGAFAHNGKEYMVEPLWYYIKGADHNLIVVYEASISKSVQDMMCGTDMSIHQSEDHDKVGHDHDGDMAGVSGNACKQVEYGAACDFAFYDEYGGGAGAQNRIDLIMNLVEGQYNNGQLQHTYEFDIVEYWFSDCNNCDPWSGSNDAGTLLSSFRSWGIGGGFSVDTDVAGLWTDRDFNGGTIGIAYLNGVCNSFGYHCLQDWTSNTSLMRVMVSHEFGHNFSCDHDAAGSNTIMAPSVNNTTTWSNNSINDINSYTNGGSGWCLSSCVPNAPPNGQFTADEVEGCTPLTVNFTDQSVNSPDSWFWSFPGGTPSFSTLQNPTVTYSTKGLYSVTLEVSNAAGSDEITKVDYINVLDVPDTYFEYIADEDFVTFFNLSDGGVTYYWEFGDGDFSFEENPVHTYEEDGVYEVILSATNQCGTTSYSEFITIVTPPIPEFSADETLGCAPMTVNFQDKSSPNTTSWMWQFPGGTPSSSTLQNPIVTYQNAGEYSVTLTAINSAGSSSVTLTNYIVVEDVPTGTFSYELVLPDTIKFTNETEDWDSLSWDFGDGSGSAEENPVHVYSDEGDYLVTLIATNGCGDFLIEQIITITAPPSADFSASPLTGCTPFEVSFMDNSSENVTAFAWSFPGGNPANSAEANPVVVYNTPGTYDVTLIVFNQAGSDTVTFVKYIEAITTPEASFTKDGEGLVTFTNTSLYGSSYAWDFGDGMMSNDENPVHQYQTEGDFMVTLTVTNACGVDTYTEVVKITLPLTAGLKADVTSGCAPLQISFSNSSSPNATGWAWSFPGGTPATSTDKNPVVIYNNAGDYSVTLIVSGASGFDTLVLTNYITVGLAPEAAYTSLNNNGMVEFSSTSSNSQSYNWNFGDGTTSFEENPIHEFAEEGLYHVTLLVENECGISTYCQPVHVFFGKDANFTSDIREACASSMIVDFEDLSGKSPDTWAWTFEGGSPATSTDQDPIITYTSAGIYDVQLIASGSGWTDTLTLTDYIRLFDAIPNASFTYEADQLNVDFANATVYGTCYEWEFEPAFISLEIDPEHKFSAFGSYNVQLIASNACGADTVVQTVTVNNTSLELPDFLTGIQVLPNPSNGLFVLELTGKPIGTVRYDVLDILGQQVHAGSVDFTASPARHTVNMPDVPSGQYFLRLWDGVRPYAIRLQIAR